jgi:hypothetical protein
MEASWRLKSLVLLEFYLRMFFKIQLFFDSTRERLPLSTHFLFVLERFMQESVLLRALQQEIRRHDFNCFIHEPPSIAQGGKGVVVPGCPAYKKRINTMSQFLDHLADDVLPALIEKLSEAKTE